MADLSWMKWTWKMVKNLGREWELDVRSELQKTDVEDGKL